MIPESSVRMLNLIHDNPLSTRNELAGIYEDALAGTISWEDARRTLRKILYE